MDKLELVQARSVDVEAVAGVLVAAAQTLITCGQTLWTVASVNADAIQSDVSAGRYWLVSEAGEPVGVFRYETMDQLFWPEVQDRRSAFLHKVAVHPKAQGRELAQRLLACACDLARDQNLRDVRLDCISERPKLRAVYERFGFCFHSPWQVGTLRVDRLIYSLGSP